MRCILIPHPRYTHRPLTLYPSRTEAVIMSDTLLQNSFYIGNVFNSILYGVELMLYFNTMQAYFEKQLEHRPSDKFYMIFSTIILFLITIFVATQLVLGQEMWIINAGYPGGAFAYFVAHVSVWYQTMGSAASILLQLMTDALLIHRCFTVWIGNYRVLLVPCCLWLSSLVFGILDLTTSGSPNGDFFEGLAARVGLVYFSLTIGLNVITTCLICGRIIFYARCMRNHPGPEVAKVYFTTVTIVVESALPYTLFGITFLVLYGLDNNTSILFLSLYGMFTCISPQMLILRVVRRRAWSAETAQPTTLVFATHSAAAPYTTSEAETCSSVV
ncbi:uncharacterized protein BJ212DRAFT_1385597 [Suillus subaureus]|uniref:Uncharacterized protein n=1 Tax=Suillus subaureus TaxID=48587 RepID=A0A9P7E0T7_9AGAM|nr:uncharacterized protein BJ212DRAFT_1385597 [Suillus subaureus]KAG1807809.1 hypothetical protein BJ212DRAFT_1385597 [Suillus subaureus]